MRCDWAGAPRRSARSALAALAAPIPLAALCGLLIAACGSTSGLPGPDAGADAALPADGAADANVTQDGALSLDAHLSDAAADAAPDAAPDAGSVEPYGPYQVDGPHAVSTGRESLSTGGGTVEVNLWVPSTAGPHPVVVLAPGYLQPAAAYAPYGRRLASHGMVVVIRDDPGAFTATTDVAADIVSTVTTGLPAANADSQSLLFGQVDLSRVGLAGHSRGGKATLLAAEGGLDGLVLGWFGLDPVDSAVLSGGAMARDHIGELAIPLAFLGAEVSSTCSPPADNFAVLYDLATSPALLLTGLGAGHTQLEDPAACFSCAGCTPQGTADGAVVLAYAVRYLTAFFARELAGDLSVGANLDGAGAALDLAAGLIARDLK